MQIRKVDLRLVWTMLLLSCLFGGIMPGAPTTTPSSTTTTGTTTTTMAGTTTTTAAPTTTIATSVAAASYAIIITLDGISKANDNNESANRTRVNVEYLHTATLEKMDCHFNTAINDFRTSVTSACNGYCATDQTTARVCCDATKNYSPSGESYLMSSGVNVYAVVEVTSTSCAVTVYLDVDPSNALCAIGTMARRKRAISGGFVTKDTFFAIFTNAQTQTSFAAAYSAAVTTTLGSATTVTVASVARAHCSSVKASGWIIMLMVLVSALAVIDFDQNSSSEDQKRVQENGQISADPNKCQIMKPMGALDTSMLAEHITTY